MLFSYVQNVKYLHAYVCRCINTAILLWSKKDEELKIFITVVYKHVNIPELNILKTYKEYFIKLIVFIFNNLF
jgi:hypothetical protein